MEVKRTAINVSRIQFGDKSFIKHSMQIIREVGVATKQQMTYLQSEKYHEALHYY